MDDVGDGFGDLPGRRCLRDHSRRHRPEHQLRGGAWTSETAWVDSGGGISPHKYRDSFVANCRGGTAAPAARKTYRNGPDVSANANFTFYVCADQTTCTANEYGGTSFAAPMWAGYLALVNQQSVANGRQDAGLHQPEPLFDRRRLEL